MRQRGCRKNQYSDCQYKRGFRHGGFHLCGIFRSRESKPQRNSSSTINDLLEQEISPTPKDSATVYRILMQKDQGRGSRIGTVHWPKLGQP